jgi:hypothetical protein
MKRPKTTEKRLEEIVSFRKKFDELGLPADHPQVRHLIDVMNEFVRGTGFTGTISLSDFGRNAIAKLSLRDGVESTIVLRAIRT